jgi:hypothetical protein
LPCFLSLNLGITHGQKSRANKQTRVELYHPAIESSPRLVPRVRRFLSCLSFRELWVRPSALSVWSKPGQMASHRVVGCGLSVRDDLIHTIHPDCLPLQNVQMQCRVPQRQLTFSSANPSHVSSCLSFSKSPFYLSLDSMNLSEITPSTCHFGDRGLGRGRDVQSKHSSRCQKPVASYRNLRRRSAR